MHHVFLERRETGGEAWSIRGIIIEYEDNSIYWQHILDQSHFSYSNGPHTKFLRIHFLNILIEISFNNYYIDEKKINYFTVI